MSCYENTVFQNPWLEALLVRLLWGGSIMLLVSRLNLTWMSEISYCSISLLV